ncbi:hypothetical protein H0H92_014671 [Tricholoma furcatifolium]|nr:hypothetical protein H0H92_014671 [Tricholoma furcatifolium]
MERDNDCPNADPELAQGPEAHRKQVAHVHDTSTDCRGVGAHRPAPLRPNTSKLQFELTTQEVESTSDEDRDHSYVQLLQRRIDAFWTQHPEVLKQSTHDKLYNRVRQTLHIMQKTAPASLPTEADKMINLVETYLGRECQEYFSREMNELTMPSPITMALTNLSQPWQPEIQMPYQPTTMAGSSVTGPAAASTPPVGKWKDCKNWGVIFVQGVAYDTLYPSVSQVHIKEEPSFHSRVPQVQEYNGIPGFELKPQSVANGNRGGGQDCPPHMSSGGGNNPPSSPPSDDRNGRGGGREGDPPCRLPLADSNFGPPLPPGRNPGQGGRGYLTPSSAPYWPAEIT